MKLSIVIPCYNEAKTIRQIVERVRAAPMPDKEMIVVSSPSFISSVASVVSCKMV
jgi:glycosyltransferase involved in cell wall biosynthesis